MIPDNMIHSLAAGSQLQRSRDFDLDLPWARLWARRLPNVLLHAEYLKFGVIPTWNDLG